MDCSQFSRSCRSKNQLKSGKIGEISLIFSPNLAKFLQIRRDLTKSRGDFMDLAKISPEMAKISPNLKNFARKCSISQFSRVLRVLGRKPANRPTVFEFQRWRPAANYHRSRVSRLSSQIGRVRCVGWVTVLFGHPQMKQINTTNFALILFISTKTINKYSQHEGRHDKHTYRLLDVKFQNETYMIHIFICIFLNIKML